MEEERRDDGDPIEIIRSNYVKPGHPTAFAGVTAVYNFYNGRYSQEKIETALQGLDAYTRHREFKQPRTYNPYYVYRPRAQVQADLIDMIAYGGQNDNVKHLLLLVDLFSRKCWVLPLINKTGEAVRDALTTWLNSDDMRQRPPKIFRSDSGTEFKNRWVSELLRSKRIKQQFASGTSKASYAERANKTLEIMVNKYITQRQSFRYIDVLDDIVQSYNSRGHRSLDGMTPNEADDPNNTQYVRGILMKNHAKRAQGANKRVKLNVGDRVRVKILPKKIGTDARAYNPQFHGEYYEVVAISKRMMVPMYRIRSMNTGETIKDSFYSNELQKVTGEVFKVERVLRTRGRGRNKELLIKWQFFDEQHNSWEPERNIVETYNNNNNQQQHQQQQQGQRQQ